MFVKLVNGHLEQAPVLLRDNEKTYSNPLPETLRAFGYKPLVETEMPVKDGFYYKKEYVENDNEIVENWIEYEIPVEEEVVVEEQEVIEENTDEPQE